MLLGKRVTLRGLHVSGREFDVELAVTALPQEELFVAHVRDVSEQLERERRLSSLTQLLEELSRAQANFISSVDGGGFDLLLSSLLRTTESEYGFIGEILTDGDGSPYLRTHAITNIAWNAETRAFHDENVASGLE